MAIYGYLRREFPRSMTDQLTVISSYKCDDLFIESEDIFDQTELNRLINQLKPMDTVVTSELATFGQSPNGLGRLIQMFERTHVRLISVTERIDTETLLTYYKWSDFTLTAAMKVKSEKHKQAVVRNKENGTLIGRPQISEEKINHIYEEYQNKLSYREIAEKCQVSLGSVHKYIKAFQEHELQK